MFGLTKLALSGRVLVTMLMIRLQRVGRKNYAEFRVVVTEKTRAAKSSNYKELLGHYNPHKDTFTVDAERVLHWISLGAQVSDTVHNLLVSQKIIEGKKINVLPKKTPIKKEVVADEKAAPDTTEETPTDTKEVVEEVPAEAKAE